jgi:potassium channel LctB
VRHYRGGLQDWTENGGALESSSIAGAAPAKRRQAASRSVSPGALVDFVTGRSVAGLLSIWLLMVLGCGLFYWTANALGAHALLEGGKPVAPGRHGLFAAIYFSFVTATSLGYGDVVPVGLARLIAVAEGAAGLLLFGLLVSKLVSRRQEQLIEEIHHIAFEDRLGRVRTNLHLAFTEMRSIATSCAEENWPRDRLLGRLESAAMVFVGELRAVHDLLYRPQQAPEEPVLEAILAQLAACLSELNGLLSHLSREADWTPSLESSRRSVATLASEICGECVPREHAPALKSWMDQIQSHARRIGAA